MPNSINNSISIIRLIESNEISEATATVAGKGMGRFIPGVGAALGAYDAYARAKEGDYTGAALSGLGGAASLIPGIGTAASIGIAGAQAMRDKARTGSYLPGEEERAAAVAKDKAAGAAVVTPTAAAPATTAASVPAIKPATNNQVLNLQKRLIAKGARIAADGIMGPKTRAAMKQFPEVQLSSKINKIKGMYMSESDKIAALRDRLAQFEVKMPVKEGKASYDKKSGQMKQDDEDSDQRHGLYVNGKLVKTCNTKSEAETTKKRDTRFKNATVKKIVEGTSDIARIAQNSWKASQAHQTAGTDLDDEDMSENIAGLAKSAWQGAKAIGQAAKTGFSGAPVATGKVTAKGAAQTVGQGSKQFQKALAATPKSQQAAYGAGKFAKKAAVPAAAGAAGVAAGAAGGYMAGKSGAAPAAAPATAQGAGKTAGGRTTPAERAELDALASELGSFEMMGADPELDNLLLQYQKLGK